MTAPDPSENFFMAIILDDLDTVKSIFSENPDALSWVTPGEYPPLHMAIRNARKEVAVWLVDQGADLKQEACGESAAKLACDWGMFDLLMGAVARREDIRQREIASFGDEMRKGLENDVVLSRKQLTFKKPGPF